MPESSSRAPATASTVESLVLRKLATTKNLVVAHAIGNDEGHVSRIASNERGIRISQLGPFLDALGLKLIECNGPVVTLPADELAAIKKLAGLYFK